MKNFALFILLSSLLFLSSCGGSNTQDYYFQLKDFKQGKVYVYESGKNGEKDYWLIKSQPNKGILTTKAYDSDFSMYNEFVEQYDDDGSKLIKYVDYWKEDGMPMGGIQYDIKQNGVINWSSSESAEFILSNEHVLINKSRNYQSETTVNVLGKEVEALVFEDIYKSSNSDQEYTTIRYYAKDYGLVRIEYGKESNLDPLNLVEIIDMKTWEELKALNK